MTVIGEIAGESRAFSEGVFSSNVSGSARAVHARERRIASVALTFDPLPAELLHLCGASGRHRLLSREERVRALLFAGLDAVMVLDFDRALADMGYEDFLARALPSLMAPRSIHVGSDFRLGRGGAGC